MFSRDDGEMAMNRYHYPCFVLIVIGVPVYCPSDTRKFCCCKAFLVHLRLMALCKTVLMHRLIYLKTFDIPDIDVT